MGTALYSAPEQYDADYKHLCELCHFFHATPPPHGQTFFTTDLGGACKLRWERHTEAQTYTFARSATADECEQPFAETSVAISVVPKKWLSSLPGFVLTGVHIAVLEDAPSDFAAISRHFHREGVVTANSVDRGRFRVYSDWRTHSDGLGRIYAHARGADNTPNKRTAAGKMLQRMVELDKYRALALLALPFAQRLSPQVDALNAELMQVTKAMRGPDSGEAGSDQAWSADLGTQRQLLDRLCSLSAEGLKLNSSSSFRFAASAAYAKIVNDRVSFLRMERIEGVPSMATFIDQALHPCVRTCDAVAARLRDTQTEMAYTADLLRTSLTVQQQAQSIRATEELRANARTQLLLQESVEGLSVVAITYYSTGVLGYMAKGASSLGWLPVPVEVALGLAVPMVGGVVWIGLSRLKAGVLGAPHRDESGHT